MNEELQLPGDRDLPEPDKMLGSIMESKPRRPARILQISAVAASIAVVLGIAVWAANGDSTDLADPPVVAPPTTSSASVSAPPSPSVAASAPSSQTPAPTAHPSASRSTTASTPDKATPSRPVVTPPRQTRTARPTSDETSTVRAEPPRRAPTRATTGRQQGTTAPAKLPIPTASNRAPTGSPVTATITVRRVEKRESGSRAHLYLQLRLCASGPNGWADRARLDGDQPDLATDENSAALATMAPLWSGRKLSIPSGQCVNRTTLWSQSSVAAAQASHTLTMSTSNGAVKVSG